MNKSDTTTIFNNYLKGYGEYILTKADFIRNWSILEKAAREAEKQNVDQEAIYKAQNQLEARVKKNNITFNMDEARTEALVLSVDCQKTFYEAFKPNPSRQRIQSANILSDKELIEITFYVQKMISSGVAWLASEPKVGKSFLALDASYCISQGLSFLGYETKKTNVMFYSLEMNENLIQNRLKLMYNNNPMPDNLYIAYDLLPFDRGGLDQLDQNLTDYDCKVAFIDMFSMVSTAKSTQKDLYSQSYDEILKIKRIAEKHDAAIILISHLNKNSTERSANRIIGSVANTGAVDFSITLEKDRINKQVRMFLESRKTEELELVLEFDRGIFANIGTSDEIADKQKREEYLNNPICSAIKISLLSRSKATLTASEILQIIPDYYRQDLTVEKIGRQMNKLEYVLKYYDKITFTKKRGKTNTIYEFTRPKNLTSLTDIMQGFTEKPALTYNKNNFIEEKEV